MEQRLFTWRFGAIALAHFLVTMTFMLLMSFVAGYAQRRFGVDGVLAGFAAGVFVLGGLAGRLALGQRIDVWGRRRSLQGALAVMLAAAVASLFLGDIWSFSIVRFIQGAAFGLATNVTNTAAMEMIPPARRGEGTGWFTLAVTLSTALGPFAGIALERSLGPEAVLWMAVACCALALLMSILTPVPEAALARDELRERGRWRLADVVEPAAAPLALVGFLSAAAFSTVLAFLGAYSAEAGFPEWGSVFFLGYAAGLVVTRPGAGRALDRFGDNIVVAPSLLCHAAALALLAVVGAPWQLLAIAVLLALGHGATSSALQAIAVGRTAPHRRSIAVSTYYVGLDGGLGVGPLLFGALAGAVGHRGMYWSAAALMLAAFALYWLLHGRRPLRPLSTVGGQPS